MTSGVLDPPTKPDDKTLSELPDLEASKGTDESVTLRGCYSPSGRTCFKSNLCVYRGKRAAMNRFHGQAKRHEMDESEQAPPPFAVGDGASVTGSDLSGFVGQPPPTSADDALALAVSRPSLG